MIRAGFLDRESRRDLIELARNRSVAHRLARRANALVLLDDGMSCDAIAKVLLLDDDTIRTWYRLYEEDGIEGLTNFGYEGSACQLSGEQQEKLKGWVTAALPRTTRQVGAAASTIRLLQSIEALHPMLALIHVFLDNARYHHAKLVQEWLAQPGRRIKLHFIPTYCPHLNPIERLWGLMHRNVTHNKCYATCAQFADATLSFLREKVPGNWADLCDSVTDNFRVINPKDFRVMT